MKTLYESLLDDFEDIEQAQDQDIINDHLKMIDASIIKYSTGARKPNYGNDYSKVGITKLEDGALRFATNGSRLEVYTIYNETLNRIKQLKDLLQGSNNIDTIISTNSVQLGDTKMDGDIIKNIEITGDSLRLDRRMHKLTGLNIKIHAIESEGSNLFTGRTVTPALISNSCMDVTFDNCKITHNASKYLKNNMISMSSLPTFNNCKITGIEGLVIYDVMGVKDADNSDFGYLFDETYKVSFEISGKITSRKATLKNVCAFANNPKKYHKLYFKPEKEGDVIFKIDPDFKLTNFINIKCFDKNLKFIEIADNNVGIFFFKKGYDQKLSEFNTNVSRLKISSMSNEFNCAELPNDKDWCVAVLKRP